MKKEKKLINEEYMAVPVDHLHKYDSGGGHVERKYAATYNLDKVEVHIVAPKPKNQDEINQCLKEYHQAFLRYWKTLPAEKCKELNRKWSKECR